MSEERIEAEGEWSKQNLENYFFDVNTLPEYVP